MLTPHDNLDTFTKTYLKIGLMIVFCLKYLKGDTVGESAAHKTKKILYGNTITGSALTSYLAGHLGHIHVSKIFEKNSAQLKDGSSSNASKTDDEDSSHVDVLDRSLSSDDKTKTNVIQKRKYMKRQSSEQHSHATSLIHQIYEKKHQQHLQQQLQLCANPGISSSDLFFTIFL